MITLLYGCFQVELTVRDLDLARDFMTATLGATRIEQQLSEEIQDLLPGSGYRVDHLDCGEATFQVNQPAPSGSYRGNESVHQSNLARIGPCVSNLNFYVDDIRHARDLLTGAGCRVLTEGPSTAARSMADYGPGNTRPGADTRAFLFVGARDLIGLDLEIMEPNFERFVEQAAQHPCFVRAADRDRSEACRLERLRIAVDDLNATYDHFLHLFTPASRSRPYEPRVSSEARAFRIWVGGIELEYCEPASRGGRVAASLSEHGPGVFTIEFSADDPGALATRAEVDWSVPVSHDPCPGEGAGGGWTVSSRDIVGFDVVLVPWAEPVPAWREDGGEPW